MLYKHFTEKLLGLQDVDIEKIEEIDNSIHIHCRLERKMHAVCDERYHLPSHPRDRRLQALPQKASVHHVQDGTSRLHHGAADL